MRRNIYGVTRKELAAYFSSLGASPAKADRLLRALCGDEPETAEGISERLFSRLREDFLFDRKLQQTV
jgi:hypothetical protein